MSDWLIAIILGLVEGLTEFLPVSSTGHLILFGDLLGFTGEKEEKFKVIIQLGAILSVVLLYRERFFALLSGLGKDISRTSAWFEPGLRGVRGLLKLGLASAPALVVGFLFRHQIKQHLFSPTPVLVAFAVGAVAMLVVDRGSRGSSGVEVDSLSWKQSFLIGCVQCFALWPGMSRSASTIVGGMLAGLSRRAAAEFSFLVAVPVLSAAALFELVDAVQIFLLEELAVVAVGFLVSFLSAVVAIKAFIGVVSRWSLRPFAWYRLAVVLVFAASFLLF